MMLNTLPTVQHVYHNHHIDGTRWQQFTPRPDDIVISTSIKSGTTWMQQIVMHLIFQDLQPRSTGEYSPWIDYSPEPLENVIEQVEKQTHRRYLKSHLPLDGLLYFPQVKYIVVGRDARDVFMSLWNHYSNYTPEYFDEVNNAPGRVGAPLPNCPTDIREFWQWWMTRGWFEWESEGYPHWSNLHHIQTWWEYRHLPNILLVHYNDLLRDLPAELQRVADYLDIDIKPDTLSAIAEAVTFRSMKQNAEKIMPGADFVWAGGAQTFINKGTNGRWRDVLTEDDLKLYEAAVARELTPDCAHWLEHGLLNP
jgi:aryl sulfotransferase